MIHSRKYILQIRNLCIILFLPLLSLKTFAQEPSEEDYRKLSAFLEAGKGIDGLNYLEKLMRQPKPEATLFLYKSSFEDARGDRRAAIDVLLYAFKLYPKNDTLLNQIGYMYRHSGELDSAKYFYMKALAVADSKEDSLIIESNTAALLLDKQMGKEAIQMLRELIVRYGDSMSLLSNLAMAYSISGKPDSATVILRNLVTRYPDEIIIYNNIGMTLIDQERYQDAYEILNQGRLQQPDNAYILNNFGYVQMKLKDYKNALININKSIALYGSNPYAYRNRALLFLETGMRYEGCRDLKAAEQLGFATYYGDEVVRLIQQHCKDEQPAKEKQ